MTLVITRYENTTTQQSDEVHRIYARMKATAHELAEQRSVPTRSDAKVIVARLIHEEDVTFFRLSDELLFAEFLKLVRTAALRARCEDQLRRATQKIDESAVTITSAAQDEGVPTHRLRTKD
jgi:hypothetical protein